MERIDKIRFLINEKFDGRQKDFADAINKPPSQVNQWLNGFRNVGDALALHIEKSLNLPHGYLNSDNSTDIELPHETAIKNNLESNIGDVGNFLLWSSNSPLSKEDFVHVPFYKDIELAAGTGSFSDVDYNGFTLPFAKATLYRHGVAPNCAICMSVTGDSMEPVLPGGSTVGIDTSKKNIIDGKMYAFRQDDMLRVKRLYRQPGGLVLIRSFNQDDPAYGDETASLADIEIIGKVFTSSTMWD